MCTSSRVPFPVYEASAAKDLEDLLDNGKTFQVCSCLI